jgi:hypothetical protein
MTMAAKKSAAKPKPGARKSPAKKSPAKKGALEKGAVRKVPAKAPPARKAPAKRAPAKKAPAKQAPGKKAPAKTPPAAKRASGNKSTPNAASVERYLAAIANPVRRKDCEALCALMATASGHPPQMWGTAIVGFGRYHYRYDSGREGDSMLVGFSSRASEIAIYGLRAAPDAVALLAKLGKHKEATACVYVKAMADVDTRVLTELVATAAVAKKKEDVAA